MPFYCTYSLASTRYVHIFRQHAQLRLSASGSHAGCHLFLVATPSIYSPGSTRNLIPLPLPVYTPHGHVARCPTEFPVTNYHLVKQTRLQYYTIGHAKPSIRGFILLCNIKCPHVHFVRDNYSESARLLDYHVLVFHDIRRSRVYINLMMK